MQHNKQFGSSQRVRSEGQHSPFNVLIRQVKRTLVMAVTSDQ